MEIAEIFGYFSALLIGVTLGLIGGGGSILSVPVLSYLFHFDEKISTAYSLCIVGVGALVGGLQKNHQKLVDWKLAFLFGIPSILGVWLIRHEVIPVIPKVLYSSETIVLTRRMLMFGVFACIMMLSSYAMISGKLFGSNSEKSFSKILIVVIGFSIGCIAGFVGAGGGFLIIPALTILMKMDMKLAIGTSLIIIAMQSLVGFFLGDAMNMKVDWTFLAVFSLLTISGIGLGSYLNNKIDGAKLKIFFGYFIMVMAVFVFVKEFILNP